MTRTTVGVAGLMFCAIGIALANGEQTLERDMLPDLRGRNWDNLEITATAFQKARKQIVANLMRQAEDESLGMAERAYAINLLGEMRATEAIQLLVRLFDYDIDNIIREYYKLQRVSRYPAMQALYNMTVPALRHIVRALPEENNEGRRRLMLIFVSSLGTKTGMHYLAEHLGKDVEDAVRQKILEDYRTVNLLDEHGERLPKRTP